MSSGRAEMMKLVKRLERAGHVVERTGSGHWKVWSKDRGDFAFLAFSPKSSGQHKTMKRLEKIGYTEK